MSAVRWRIVAAALIGSALLVGGCGGNDTAAGGHAGTSTTVPASEIAPGSTAPLGEQRTTTTTTSLASAPMVVEVELADFSFDGLPASVPAGTRLTVTNSSPVELHKLSALPLPPGEDRSVEELLALPGAEQAAILRVTPATVLVAGPGGPQVAEIGDGTLTVPGRYLLICAVPVGLDPDEYLDALAGDGRRPRVSGDGAPHFRLGMVADIVVEPAVHTR